ncbi:MAG: hypothetical protein WBR13_08895 [Allosphingosinicella sp.]
MPKKVAGGWAAEFGDRFSVVVPGRRIAAARAAPTAIYIHGPLVRGGRTYIDYAGTDTDLLSMEVPSDPDFLRDLAEALIARADEIEAGWQPA